LGSEAVCSVSYAGRVSEGKALLETTEVLFRGDFRLKIPFAEITSVASDDGALYLGYEGDVAVFDLGRDADKWAEKIRNPRGLLDKLGIKPGMYTAVLGVEDADFLDQLTARAGAPDRSIDAGDLDIILYEANSLDDLARLPELRNAIKPAGAIWVVSPKGKGIVVRDVDVMAAAREAGLVDNKVVSFSATHTGLRLVIPRAARK
jgi:hypothetical protein